MDLTLLWTNSAIEQLENIFDYYKEKAGIKVAKHIVGKIIDSTILLESQSKIGQIEELLKGRDKEYRYLVESNYKIIYWIKEPYINIAAVFDCRQNPTKLKKIK